MFTLRLLVMHLSLNNYQSALFRWKPDLATATSSDFDPNSDNTYIIDEGFTFDIQKWLKSEITMYLTNEYSVISTDLPFLYTW